MPRFHHGCPYRHDDVASEAVVSGPTAHASAAAQPAPDKQTNFGFLFPDLQAPTVNNPALLSKEIDTVKALVALGATMDDSREENALNSTIPAIFTYFGQFIAHDITWEKGTPNMTVLTEIKPWEPDQVAALVNKRSGSLDLDCVYGQAPFEAPLAANGKLKIAAVDPNGDLPPGKSVFNDVPRKPHIPTMEEGEVEPEESRAAIIGDPRNDANIIISQLHVAFLHAHNNLMESGESFENARTKLMQLYQTIIVEDYLTRIILPDVLDQFRQQPDLFYTGRFMPVEFSAAAFRFGHTMIRGSYDLNSQLIRVQLEELIGMPPLKYSRLPQGWVIEWEHFVGNNGKRARQISTQMVEPLSLLRDSPDNPFKLADFPDTPSKAGKSLAIRDLLRGYLFRLPTGQAVAKRIGVEHDIITEADFQRLLPTSQFNVLRDSKFIDNTPLWFYVLAEAVREKERQPEKDYLGVVGSHLVAGVLMGLLFRSTNSVLKHGNSKLGTTLSDLLRLAGVLP